MSSALLLFMLSAVVLLSYTRPHPPKSIAATGSLYRTHGTKPLSAGTRLCSFPQGADAVGVYPYARCFRFGAAPKSGEKIA
ncbi:MAG: hypothetical protein DMG30_08680 [Acidobacteria bacterium]|nr:MAG: hypothetical protein DMG30_08680 [Acidobacteriota bacterium]